MRVYIISDTHFNHTKIATYCDRPENFTEVLVRNWRNTIQPTDFVIHLGDVFIGGVEGWKNVYPHLTGRKLLVRGNHDRNRSLTWWMNNGFDFAVDSTVFRNMWLTHEPAASLPTGCELNLHGHLHNIWDGFKPDGEENYTRLKFDWQRLFAVEYTNYLPVEWDKFIHHPDKYQARGKIFLQKA